MSVSHRELTFRPVFTPGGEHLTPGGRERLARGVMVQDQKRSESCSSQGLEGYLLTVYRSSADRGVSPAISSWANHLILVGTRMRGESGFLPVPQKRGRNSIRLFPVTPERPAVVLETSQSGYTCFKPLDRPAVTGHSIGGCNFAKGSNCEWGDFMHLMFGENRFRSVAFPIQDEVLSAEEIASNRL